MKTTPQPAPTGRLDVLVMRMADALARRAITEAPELAEAWDAARPFVEGWAQTNFSPKPKRKT